MTTGMDYLLRLLSKSMIGICAVCLWSGSVIAYPFIGISINNGEKYSNKKVVSIEIRSLQIDKKLIQSMQIGNSPELDQSTWLDYSEDPIKYTLPEGEGRKIIYVRLKDKNGNVSPTETSSIILDSTPPKARQLLINHGAIYTNNKQMKVLLSLDAEEAVKMQVSNNPEFKEAQWEMFRPQKSWLLSPPGDGEKVVYARFADAAENISQVLQATITLDTDPPQNCSVIINNDEKFITSPKAEVTIKASGADKVRLLDRSGQEKILDFGSQTSLSINWTFDEEPGLKIVRAYFIDKAQNFTSQTIQDDIIFDPQAPSPPLLRINNGDTHTNHSTGIVTLQINSRENPTGFIMYIGNKMQLSEMEKIKYAPMISQWPIPAEEDGEKWIFAGLQDEAGNVSEFTKASIILDRKPPVVKAIIINDGKKITNDNKVKINIAVEGADFMQVSANPNISKSNNWQPFIAEIQSFQLPLGDGDKKLYFIFKDKAGNVSEVATAGIKLDESAPKGAFTFAKAQQFTNQRKVWLLLKTGDAQYYQISHLQGFKNSTWIPAGDSITSYTLPDQDGEYQLYFRLKDAIGNITDPSTLTVLLDRQSPPKATFTINNGAEWFNRIDMKVSLSFASSGGDEVMISNSADFVNAQWQPLQRTIGWRLDGASDGLKTVYAKLKDKAGNESEISSASITVDTRGPLLHQFEINQGATYTNKLSRMVSLKIEADGADSIYLSNEPIDIKSITEWMPFQDSLGWKLMDQDGVLTVYGLLKDKAGNISQTYSDHIILDRVPPDFARVFINNNARFTNTSQVQVRLIAREAVKMKISNYPRLDSAEWMPYVSLIENWTLDSLREGRKMVYAWFMDKAGNISDAIADDIILDRVAPDNITVAYRNDSTSAEEAWIVIKATDPKTMQWSFEENWQNADWQKYEPEFKIKLPEEKKQINFLIRFRDEAENTTQVFSKLITKPDENDKQENKNE